MNGQTSINVFDFQLICEYFASVDRQGPGTDAATRKALELTEGLPPHPDICDIGCGTGSSALLLARETQGRVTAVDLFPRFIRQVESQAARYGLSERLKGCVADMAGLSFSDASFDLLWAEGSIYNVGFGRGLRLWHRLLRPGGCIAVSEATWFLPEPPQDVLDFWNDAYPEIDTMPRKLQLLEQAGYEPLAAFRLPKEAWTDAFYRPQATAQEKFLKAHPDSATARSLVDNQRREAQLYEKYHDYYGYAFYIGRKPR